MPVAAPVAFSYASGGTDHDVTTNNDRTRGALSFWGSSRFLREYYLNGAQQSAYAGGTTKVAVAAAPLAYGSDITPDKVRFVDYPNTSIRPVPSLTP